jgi:RND family efflux transporter MFP subunit
MKTSAKTKIGIVIIVAAIFTGTAYKLIDVKQDKKDKVDLVNRSKSEVPVTVVTAAYKDAAYDISYHGTFEPNCEVTVVSEAQGRVKDFSAEEGVFVPEGKIIAWLENDILSYQLDAAESAYLKARSDLERFGNLSQGEAVSTQQLEEVKLAFASAKSNYLTVKKQYGDTFIKAPVSGTVTRRYIERGAFIAPGTPVVDIIDTRKMKFVAWFSAADLVRVRSGQTVKVTSDLYPDASYEGVIKVVNIKPDESKRYRIQAEVQNNTGRPLIPGTGGILTLRQKLEKKNITIPRNCITGSVIEPAVYVVENGVARLRRVIVAGIVNGQALISDGLSDGEQVVLSGQINLEDNTKVAVSVNQNL